ncbi:MAG: GyrI-like domain-containing protein [Anaerolineae bacterium]|nr:GyrI-like domain-containing protein [Anaerolineae bacterium]
MEKRDIKKELAHLYNPSKRCELVQVPPLRFLMLDGHGNPNNNPVYQETVEILYALAYTLKFAAKKSMGLDYSVMPLEGLWWTPDMNQFSLEDKDAWDWTMMIMQPEWITVEMVQTACDDVRRKKKLSTLEQVRFEVYDEGLAAQIMYLGAYADEGPTIATLHAFIAEQGYERRGKHHEIYLGDPRRTAPEKLKTVIRQPVAKTED